MEQNKVVRLKKVTKDYRLDQVMLTALNKVDLILSEGDVIVIAGPSGSGKSTLLNLTGCIDKPTKGKIIIDGVDTTDMSLEALSKFRLDKIGFIFQSFNLIPVLTIYENVELPLLFTNLPPPGNKRKR